MREWPAGNDAVVRAGRSVRHDGEVREPPRPRARRQLRVHDVRPGVSADHRPARAGPGAGAGRQARRAGALRLHHARPRHRHPRRVAPLRRRLRHRSHHLALPDGRLGRRGARDPCLRPRHGRARPDRPRQPRRAGRPRRRDRRAAARPRARRRPAARLASQAPRLRHRRALVPSRTAGRDLGYTSGAMRLGILIPTRGAVMQSARRPPVEECWTMARHADHAGYDAVWVGDSIVAKPRLEPLTTLAYLAGITTRVRLGTAVLLPALRHPVVLAHQIANVDQISRGRVVLGLGVGWSLPSAEREWAACGADHKRRVRRLEEHVEVWRMLWRGEPLTRTGEDFALTEHTIGPLPWHPAGPPVLITAANRGEMLAAQFDRFGRLGDGIITTYVHAEECRLVRERAEEALARHDRTGVGFTLCVYPTVRMEDDPRTAQRVTTEFLATYYGGGVRSPGSMGLGPADVVIAALQRYAAAGVSDLCIRFVGDDQLAQLERFTTEVLPGLRG